MSRTQEEVERPNVRRPASFENEGGVVPTVSGRAVRCRDGVNDRDGVNEVASCRKKNMCAANRQSQEKTFVCVCVEEALLLGQAGGPH